MEARRTHRQELEEQARLAEEERERVKTLEARIAELQRVNEEQQEEQRQRGQQELKQDEEDDQRRRQQEADSRLYRTPEQTSKRNQVSTINNLMANTVEQLVPAEIVPN